MMLLISALLLLALTPTSLAEQLLSLPPMAPPATFTETFTPVPIEAVTTITQTLPSLPTLPSPSLLPFKETSVPIDGPVQTVVSLPVGDIYHRVPRDRFLGLMLGSIIAVDAVATTYELNCNTKDLNCPTDDISLKITQGPSSARYGFTFQASDMTVSRIVDCTSIAPAPYSCIDIISGTDIYPTKTTYISTATYTYTEATATTGGEETEHGYGIGETIPYIPVGITGGVEKIAAFQASKGSTSIASPTPAIGSSTLGSSTTSAGVAETSKSGAVSLNRDIWMAALVIMGMIFAAL